MKTGKPQPPLSEVEYPQGYFVYKLRKGFTVETNVPLEAQDFVLE